MTKLIGAELLRSFSAGIALADPQSGLVLFANPAFSSWFSTRGKGDVIAEVLPGLAEAAADLDESDAITVEARVRQRRRELAIEVTVRLAVDDGRAVLVLECQNISRLKETEAMIDTYAALSEQRVRELEADKARIEARAMDLGSQNSRQSTSGTPRTMLFEPVSAIVFDFSDLHERIRTADPAEILRELNKIFSVCEELAGAHDCIRVNGLSDTFVAIAGMPGPDPDHSGNAARCAVAIMRHIETLNAVGTRPWLARIAVATGSAIGSMAGPRNHVSDVFGSSLECARQIKSTCAPMQILVCDTLADALVEDFVLSPKRTVCPQVHDPKTRVAALDHQQGAARLRRT